MYGNLIFWALETAVRLWCLQELSLAMQLRHYGKENGKTNSLAASNDWRGIFITKCLILAALSYMP